MKKKTTTKNPYAPIYDKRSKTPSGGAYREKVETPKVQPPSKRK